MRRRDVSLTGACVIDPSVHTDRRGFFMEAWNSHKARELGIDRKWVQDNHSMSHRGVLRGLHYQLRYAQAKLVRVIVGRVYDVVVDIRVGSPTFGQWLGLELSAESKALLFVPEGCAHGFYVLSDTAEVVYKCSEWYVPDDQHGIAWNDPELAIPWPINGRQPVLSMRDASLETLANRPLQDYPVYGGESL